MASYKYFPPKKCEFSIKIQIFVCKIEFSFNSKYLALSGGVCPLNGAGFSQNQVPLNRDFNVLFWIECVTYSQVEKFSLAI